MKDTVVPLKRELANEFSLYGVRHARAALDREKHLVEYLIKKDDEVGLRRHINMYASKTRVGELNRDQLVQVAAIFIKEIEFMCNLSNVREVAVTNAINNPSELNAFPLDKP